MCYLPRVLTQRDTAAAPLTAPEGSRTATHAREAQPRAKAARDALLRPLLGAMDAALRAPAMPPDADPGDASRPHPTSAERTRRYRGRLRAQQRLVSVALTRQQIYALADKRYLAWDCLDDPRVIAAALHNLLVRVL